MTYSYAYPSQYAQHPKWPPPSSAMPVHFPSTMVPQMDSGVPLPAVDERLLGQGRYRPSARPERQSSHREGRHRDRHHHHHRHGHHGHQGRRTERESRSDHKPRAIENEQLYRRDHTDTPSEAHSIIAHAGSFGSCRRRRNRSEPSPFRSTEHYLESTPATRPVTHSYIHDDTDTRNRARQTLRWVRNLVPGLAPPSATTPLTTRSPPPAYFEHSAEPVPPRPSFLRQSGWGDSVRRLSTFASTNERPVPPAYQAPSTRYPERALPVPRLPSSATAAAPPAQNYPPVPPPARVYALNPASSHSPPPPPPKDRYHHREHSPARFFGCVAAPFRPRKVRFADGGQPGSSEVGGQ